VRCRRSRWRRPPRRGATGLRTSLFGSLPQATNPFASLTLYKWGCNIRSATILGFVGAGGIGQQILISMNLFDYSKVATLVGVTMIVVLLVDRSSAAVRRRFANF
jgi:phosphonate transport system permease protein